MSLGLCGGRCIGLASSVLCCGRMLSTVFSGLVGVVGAVVCESVFAVRGVTTLGASFCLIGVVCLFIGILPATLVVLVNAFLRISFALLSIAPK